MMDLNLGDDSGVEATREIVARTPDVGVLVVTMVDDDDTVFAAMRAGARGYLLKGAGPVEIERALRAVAAGEVLLSPAVAAGAMAMFTGPATPRSRPVPVAHRPRARGARAGRRRARQPSHRHSACR